MPRTNQSVRKIVVGKRVSESTTSNPDPVNKQKRSLKKRFRPGVKALREIRQYQKSHDLLIPRTAFSRLVREICSNSSRTAAAHRWEVRALEALQEAAEAHLVLLLSSAMLCGFHAKRVTLMARDIQLARRIGGFEKNMH